MNDFREVQLQDIAEVLVSNVDKKSYSGQQTVRLCNYMDVYSNDYISSNLNFMESTASDAEIKKFSLRKGDVIITKDSESPFDIGIPTVVIEDIEHLVCGYHLAIIRPVTDKVDPLYLAKQLSSEKSVKYFARVAAGSTRFGLSVGSILTLPIHVMPLDIQRKIGKIGLTIDNQIDSTQALINKYTAIKQGMMADLFSRGIDPETKALRPTFEEAPELYYQTPLGMLPKGWFSLSMAGVSAEGKGSTVIGPFGSDLVAADYATEGVPIVFVRDVKENNFYWKSNTYVSHVKAKALAAHSAEPGDVIVTKMGLPPCIAAVYPDTMPNGVITADIIRLRPNDELVFSEWIAIAINSNEMRKQVEAITAGVTRPKVTLKDFRQLVGRFPPKKEQKLILDRLEPIQSLIESEEAVVIKLQRQKIGLMQDLLTGKVAIPTKTNHKKNMAA
ncbi:restriction endonuclease subunit S [Xenorhabdus bovienii]|uniref:restriction endonuclease subunit S n=1 Tax=Xenorhabdus bovienii TaxID=40576 RepID=UPI00237C55A7|nr:restriction endonuclease subunit S [Xenorhabdus bovienii]MDE1482177.1 restriction endonuclease subunit S [Xenorhabdus bovienii]MDE9465603.1 restriction endonuclease subunit S [Xenorhabdus bovienii]MDE9468816.1 restriction endonuclease subunit S [Xenorhabdus bovienii]MDE9547589.1 restriction endonuclease subunit S [Xenorhabdus bovienii]